jgi:hypothetical protein
MEEREWEWEWDLEHKVKDWVENESAGKAHCTLCAANALEESTARGYLVVGRTLRMLATWFPDKYEAFKGKCEKHTAGSEMFWMMRKR